MLSPKNRLKKEDFKDLFKKGKYFHHSSFNIIYTYNDNLRSPQIGIVIAAKIGKASKRNKIKRQIREIFKKNIEKIKPSLQLAVICKPQVVEQDFASLSKTILDSLKNIRVLKNTRNAR